MDYRFFIIFLMTFRKSDHLNTDKENSNDDVNDQTDLICFFQLPNIVITDDKTIYLFFHKHFWILDFDSNRNKLIANNSTAKLISEFWENLPNDFNIGFTIAQSTFQNPFAGYTIFLKGDQYYLFQNNTFITNGSNFKWHPNIWSNWRYFIVVRNSTLVLLNLLDIRDLVMSPVKNNMAFGKTFSFDNIDLPDMRNDFEISIQDIGFDLTTLRFLIPFPFDRKYLAVFSIKREGFYCIMDQLNGQCDEEPIHQIFNCSADILLTKQNDWIYLVWKTFNLNVHDLLTVLMGSTLAALIINFLFFIISVNRQIEII